MNGVAGWMRRLARPGARLAALPGGRGGFGVYPGGDRRRRPLATVNSARVEAALRDGWLLHGADQAYGLSTAGRALCEGEGEAGAGGAPARPERRRVMPDPDGGVRTVSVNAETLAPLARFARPRQGRPALLDPVHLSAAETLMREYERSALRSRVTQDWSGVPGGKTRAAPRDRSEAPVSRLDAQSRVLDALAAVGPGLDRLLIAVLIREQGLGAAERGLDWPDRSGAPALRLALDRLAIHYRLKPRPKPADPFG